MLFYGKVDEILALLAGRMQDVTLDRAALSLARIEYPDLDVRASLAHLDRIAAELGSRLRNGGGEEYVGAANRYLFGELGFAGNGENYYDPRNSCLNDVLISRRGIPITLSIVYIEVARRLRRQIAGIGLPGHFLVRYEDPFFSAYIDPFHRGRLLSADECFALAKQATGSDIPRNPAYLEPVTQRQILLRMVGNLRSVYFLRRAYPKALHVLNLMLQVNPDSADEYKQRGIVFTQLNRVREARADFEKYLDLAPGASDREDIEKQVLSLKQYQAGLN